MKTVLCEKYELLFTHDIRVYALIEGCNAGLILGYDNPCDITFSFNSYLLSFSKPQAVYFVGNVNKADTKQE